MPQYIAESKKSPPTVTVQPAGLDQQTVTQYARPSAIQIPNQDDNAGLWIGRCGICQASRNNERGRYPELQQSPLAQYQEPFQQVQGAQHQPLYQDVPAIRRKDQVCDKRIII